MDYYALSAILLVVFDVILTFSAILWAHSRGQRTVLRAVADPEFLGAASRPVIKALFEQIGEKDLKAMYEKYFLKQTSAGDWILSDQAHQLLHLIYMEMVHFLQTSTDGAAAQIERRGKGGGLIKQGGWIHDLLQLVTDPTVQKFLGMGNDK